MGKSETKPLLMWSITVVVAVSLLLLTPTARAQNPDFAIAATPYLLCTNAGVNANSIITFHSIGGFSGNVSVADNIDPVVSQGPTLSPIPSSVVLASGQTVAFNLTITTTTATPARFYTITISGLSGTYHSTTIQLTINSDCSVGGTAVPNSGLRLPASFGYAAVIIGLSGVLAVTAIALRARGKSDT